MNFVKRIFGARGKKTLTPAEPMRGTGPLQTHAEQEQTRDKMEAEMLAERNKRDAKASEDTEQRKPD